MLLSVRCSCGQKLKVKEEYAGKRIKCPVCQLVLTVPAAPVVVETPPDTPKEDDSGEIRLQRPPEPPRLPPQIGKKKKRPVEDEEPPEKPKQSRRSSKSSQEGRYSPAAISAFAAAGITSFLVLFFVTRSLFGPPAQATAAPKDDRVGAAPVAANPGPPKVAETSAPTPAPSAAKELSLQTRTLPFKAAGFAFDPPSGTMAAVDVTRRQIAVLKPAYLEGDDNAKVGPISLDEKLHRATIALKPWQGKMLVLVGTDKILQAYDAATLQPVEIAALKNLPTLEFPIHSLIVSRFDDDRWVRLMSSGHPELTIDLSGSAVRSFDSRRYDPNFLASVSDSRTSSPIAVADPYGEILKTNSDFLANTGLMEARKIELPHDALCIMEHQPFVVTLADGKLKFTRRDGGPSVAEAPLPSDLAQRLPNTKNHDPSQRPRVFEDAPRRALLVAYEDQVSVLPTKDISFPTTPSMLLKFPGRMLFNPGRKSEVPIEAVDPGVKITASELPTGAKFENGMLSWTPTLNQLGVHSIRLRLDSGVETRNRPLAVTVDIPAVDVPFPVRHVDMAEDNRHVAAASDRDPTGTTQLALVDCETRKIVASTKLVLPPRRVILTADRVVVAHEVSTGRGESSVSGFTIYNRADLSEERVVHLNEPAQQMLVFSDKAILLRNGLRHGVLVLPDLHELRRLPGPVLVDNISNLQPFETAVQATIDGWIIDRVPYHRDLSRPMYLVGLPGVPQLPGVVALGGGGYDLNGQWRQAYSNASQFFTKDGSPNYFGAAAYSFAFTPAMKYVGMHRDSELLLIPGDLFGILTSGPENPLRIRPKAPDQFVAKGSDARLVFDIEGGTPPYTLTTGIQYGSTKREARNLITVADETRTVTVDIAALEKLMLHPERSRPSDLEQLIESDLRRSAAPEKYIDTAIQRANSWLELVGDRRIKEFPVVVPVSLGVADSQKKNAGISQPLLLTFPVDAVRKIVDARLKDPEFMKIREAIRKDSVDHQMERDDQTPPPSMLKK